MGRVRKRRSAGRGTRYQAVARCNGREVPLGTYDSFEDAVDAWQRAEVAARRGAGGHTLAGNRITFAELVELYFTSASLESTTRKAYRSHCNSHLLPRFGPVLLRDLDAAAVGAWMNDQIKAQVSLRMRVSARSTLSSILSFAVSNGRIGHNPVGATRAPKTAPLARRRPVLRPEQWPALRREFNDYGSETQLLLDLTINTGLRFGELTDLRPEHLVDRGANPYLKIETVAVWPGEKNSNNGDVVERKYYTKGSGDRRVDLSPAAYASVQAHIGAHRLGPQDLLFHADRLRAEHHCWRDSRDDEQRATFEAQWQARMANEPLSTERFVVTRVDGKVRSGEHGRPHTFSLGCRCAHCSYANTSYNRGRRAAQRLAERGDATPRHRGPAARGRPEIREPWLSAQWWSAVVWRPALDRAGLQWLHWHDLRHAHATWLLAAGVPARSVQKRLGHRHLTTTEIYLGELTDADDVASYLGVYHDIFAAALRGQLWDEKAEAERQVLLAASSAVTPGATVEVLGELLAQLPPEQVAQLLTQALTRGTTSPTRDAGPR